MPGTPFMMAVSITVAPFWASVSTRTPSGWTKVILVMGLTGIAVGSRYRGWGGGLEPLCCHTLVGQPQGGTNERACGRSFISRWAPVSRPGASYRGLALGLEPQQTLKVMLLDAEHGLDSSNLAEDRVAIAANTAIFFGDNQIVFRCVRVGHELENPGT